MTWKISIPIGDDWELIGVTNSRQLAEGWKQGIHGDIREIDELKLTSDKEFPPLKEDA